jgi:hypothetical protein
MPQWMPDQSFYPSPRLAMEAPQEKIAYVALLNAHKDGADALGDRSRSRFGPLRQAGIQNRNPGLGLCRVHSLYLRDRYRWFRDPLPQYQSKQSCQQRDEHERLSVMKRAFSTSAEIISLAVI